MPVTQPLEQACAASASQAEARVRPLALLLQTQHWVHSITAASSEAVKTSDMMTAAVVAVVAAMVKARTVVPMLQQRQDIGG